MHFSGWMIWSNCISQHLEKHRGIWKSEADESDFGRATWPFGGYDSMTAASHASTVMKWTRACEWHSTVWEALHQHSSPPPPASSKHYYCHHQQPKGFAGTYEKMCWTKKTSVTHHLFSRNLLSRINRLLLTDNIQGIVGSERIWVISCLLFDPLWGIDSSLFGGPKSTLRALSAG